MFTPFADTVESPSDAVTRPVMGFHVLDGGPAVGNRFQLAFTVGLLRRAEIGYAYSAVSAGELESLSPLFDRGFNIIHGKVTVLQEDAAARPWPAIAVGGLLRYQRRHLEDGLGVATQNGDLFLAATKRLRADAPVSIVVNGGVKMTNAALMGLAGNTPEWTALGFLSGGVVFGDLVTIGGEFVQQPDEVDGMPEIDLPDTVSAFGRITPQGRRFSVDVALVRIAGEIGLDTDVQADHQFVVGGSLRF
jgi:hypothetical protein